MIEDSAQSWITGQLALTLLAVDPAGLGGLHLRSRASPVRDIFLGSRPPSLAPLRRITPNIADAQLFGGIDISGTLAQGRVVKSKGLLAEPQFLLLTMAERCTAGLAARLAQALDTQMGHCLILMDEGADDDEVAPMALRERLAFSLELDGLRAAELAEIVLDQHDVLRARKAVGEIGVPEDALEMLVVTAARFGIDSLRAPLLALACARAHAALVGHTAVTGEDLQIAAQLVYSHRATMIPQEAEDSPDQPDQAPEPEEPQNHEADENLQDIPSEMLIEAVKALLPPEILSALDKPGSAKGAKGSGGAGQKRKGNRRGRPLPSRLGTPTGDNRIDIVATLRAAAPWQPMRRKAQPKASGLLIRSSDIHIRQYQELSDRLIIFGVDASGSSAVARLSEAKGAVELMLGEAYSRRDHVALIAFRGEGAEVILSPTRSLVQTKRRLAGLPGGGGTPLAAGLKAMSELAQQAQSQGLSPSLAILTDGRTNVPLPGRVGRAAAKEDAETMAGVLRLMNLPSVMVDTSVRPQRDLNVLAGVLGATYVPLPRADSRGLSKAIGAALEV